MQTHPERDSAFGRGIARLMRQHDISQRLLADFAECAPRTVRLAIQGVTVPKPDTAERMAAVFRMTVEEVEALGEEADEAAEAPR